MILSRHILKAHLGPFVFSNAIILFLFLLQFLMRAASDLVGKGLGADVILELIALNLAWMVVLAVPMSVLVATLMAFGRMASENETTIMRASGMSLYRMMAPVFAAAILISVGLLYFNNSILPEANIRLRTLMSDIIRIKPTFSIRAGVFTNEEQIPNYRILVRRTFENSNELEGITIYDLSRPEKNIVLTARRGTVNFTGDYTALIMDMEDGEIHELADASPLGYRCLRFRRHKVVISASGFGFQRSNAASAQRDDRTMSAGMMRTVVDSIIVVRDEKRRMIAEKHLRQLRAACAGGQISVLPQAVTPPVPVASVADSTAAAPACTRQDSLSALERATNTLRQLQALTQNDAQVLSVDDRMIDKYLVEIYKKYSIPTACLVFIFIGAPLGMMVRKGGFGVGAGFSLMFFLFYWACLIGGEKLADRNVLSPFWGMWAANIVLGFMGIILTIQTAREAGFGHAAAGAARDLLMRIRRPFLRKHRGDR